MSAWWWWLASYSSALDGECGIPPCKSGCYLNNANDQCVVSPEGFFSPTDANELYECEAGTFSKMGYGFCLPCPPGAHNRDSASSTCHPCPQASYTPEPGFVECLDCNGALYSGWGSDRVVEYGGQEFCQRPGSTNQILTLNPTMAPTGSPLVSMEPTGVATSLPSRSPRPTVSVDKNQTTEEASMQPSQQPTTPRSRSPAIHDEDYSASPSVSPSSSPLSQPTMPATGIPMTSQPAATSAAPSISVVDPVAPTKPPTDVETTSSNRFRKTFFRVLPVFLAALVITIVACCVRSYKSRGGPKEVRVISRHQTAASKAGAESSPSGEECSSMGDVYIDDEDYDDVFASVELGSSSAESSSGHS